MRQLFIDQYNSLEKITGLPFVRRGNRMIAACYMNGAPNRQKDKTYAILKEHGVIIIEQGGDNITIMEWLDRYGNLSALRNASSNTSAPLVHQVERIFVDPIHWESTMPASYSGNLYMFLRNYFGFTAVEEVFRKYNVGENGDEMIFWRMNESHNVCFDSRISYGPNGKRMKDRGGYRKHTLDMGYNAPAVFGQHLIGLESTVCVVESEKTALIMAMVEKKGRIWVANGGSNQMGLVKDGWKLFPDRDSAGSFWECFGCSRSGSKECIIRTEAQKRVKNWGCEYACSDVSKWWNGFDVNEGDDVGDLVLKLIENKNNK